MKSGTESKLKFKQLQRHFSLPLWQARGLLDTLWEFTRHNAPAGDIGRFTNDEIAVGIDWQDEAEDLISALIKFRWVDKDSQNRLVIHDWADHCEDSIHRMLARSTEVFADGTIPKLTGIETKFREQIHTKYEVKYGKDAVKKGKVKRAPTGVSGGPRGPRGPFKTPEKTPTMPLPSHTITKPLPSQAIVGAAEPQSEPAGPKVTPPEANPSPQRAEDVPIPPALDVPGFRAVVTAWFAQRRRRGLSMRPDHIARQYARLVPLGPVAAAECVQSTVDQDYQGIFPEKFAAKQARAADPRGNLASYHSFVSGLEDDDGEK